MPSCAPRVRALSACLAALCIGAAACDGQRDSGFGPRGTALPPPGLEAPSPPSGAAAPAATGAAEAAAPRGASPRAPWPGCGRLA